MISHENTICILWQHVLLIRLRAAEVLNKNYHRYLNRNRYYSEYSLSHSGIDIIS